MPCQRPFCCHLFLGLAPRVAAEQSGQWLLGRGTRVPNRSGRSLLDFPTYLRSCFLSSFFSCAANLTGAKGKVPLFLHTRGRLVPSCGVFFCLFFFYFWLWRVMPVVLRNSQWGRVQFDWLPRCFFFPVVFWIPPRPAPRTLLGVRCLPTGRGEPPLALFQRSSSPGPSFSFVPP